MPHKPFAKSNLWSFILLGAAVGFVMWEAARIALIP